MVNVTKANFLSQLGDFLLHLPSASFIAIDEEMSGISIPPNLRENGNAGRPNKIELPAERYSNSLKAVPERYSILQVGVALFHKNPEIEGGPSEKSNGVVRGARGAPDEDDADDVEGAEQAEHAYMHREGMLTTDELEDLTEREEEEDAADGNANSSGVKPEYTSRIYNFYLFPSANSSSSSAHAEREMTLNPSTVKFLLENNMDFDKVFREGVPFTTVSRANHLKESFFRKHNTKSNGSSSGPSSPAPASSGTPRKNRVKLTRPEDIAFVARTMAGLREWIDSDVSNGGDGDGEANNNGGDNGDDASSTAAVAGVNQGGDNGNDRSEGTSLILPPCNAFLRRCLYETIEDEYPGLVLERADSDQNAGVARNQIRVIRLSAEEKKRRENRLRKEEWNRLLQDVIGFTTVFQAISNVCNGKTYDNEQVIDFMNGQNSKFCINDDDKNESREVPLIIHNGLMDLMFLLTHCHEHKLPESFEETKKVIRDYFPIIYDTKILSSECSDAIVRGGSTALGDLYGAFCQNDGDPSQIFEVPPIENTRMSSGQAHEAAWDAYMTGCVFNSLTNRILDSKFREDVTLSKFLNGAENYEGIEISSSLRGWFGLNKIYMHMSLYTIDLESSLGPAGLHDPLSIGLSVETTFHVSGFASSVSTRDILQALTNRVDGISELLQQLKYEIIWVDDTSFFVGTKMDDGVSLDDSTSISLVATHVKLRLLAGLGDVKILAMDDYFKHIGKIKNDSDSFGLVESIVSAVKSSYNGLGGLLGFGRTSMNDEENGERSRKRRRFE